MSCIAIHFIIPLFFIKHYYQNKGCSLPWFIIKWVHDNTSMAFIPLIKDIKDTVATVKLFFTFLVFIGMLSGLQAVLASQPSQVWPMPMPRLSHQDSPTTGTKFTTTCLSCARPSTVPPTHWRMSYRQGGGWGKKTKQNTG